MDWAPDPRWVRTARNLSPRIRAKVPRNPLTRSTARTVARERTRAMAREKEPLRRPSPDEAGAGDVVPGGSVRTPRVVPGPAAVADPGVPGPEVTGPVRMVRRPYPALVRTGSTL